MLRALISLFVSQDAALDMLEDNKEKITHLSQKNKHLTGVVKTGFKIWSIWKLIVMIWYVLLLLFLLGGAYVVYVLVSKII